MNPDREFLSLIAENSALRAQAQKYKALYEKEVAKNKVAFQNAQSNIGNILSALVNK